MIFIQMVTWGNPPSVPPLRKVLRGFQWVAGGGRLVFRKEASHARYRPVPLSVGG